MSIASIIKLNLIEMTSQQIADQMLSVHQMRSIYHKRGDFSLDDEWDSEIEEFTKIINKQGIVR